MKNNINKLFMISFMVFCYGKAMSQQHPYGKFQMNTKYSYTDSLINEFRNSVYNCFYNPSFSSKNKKPIFTMIKVDVDNNGAIKAISFSDSADSLFVNTYLKRIKYHDEKQTLKKYAAAKLYKNISILIPVSYEPLYSPQHNFEDNAVKNILKFNNHDFSGDAIMLEPIKIRVLTDHNI